MKGSANCRQSVMIILGSAPILYAPCTRLDALFREDYVNENPFFNALDSAAKIFHGEGNPPGGDALPPTTFTPLYE
ncbi:hypothetical protein CEXT_261461 [Caerostris extrusa]|uniref:Uncharacterized protein n=1 Tax=Caerostris extrusa TaxID=172846 RepID=A0AAV4QSA8_CAEEX|nr:hypothetical protein CEXT_261461 [Caerostris extrusa]